MTRYAAVLGLALVLGATGPASAAPVKGTIVLPAELKSGRRHLGYWRVDNGNVPVQPPPHRGETVVVLEAKGQPPPARTVTVDISGLQAVPPTVVVAEGSVVEFRNSDKVPHDLHTPGQESLMALERLKPGALRRQKFLVAGGYVVRDLEYPHLAISVVVVNTPHHAVADEKGGFRIADAPDGKATLKVWSHGRWVHEEEIEVGKNGDLQIKVSGAPAAAKEPND